MGRAGDTTQKGSMKESFGEVHLTAAAWCHHLVPKRGVGCLFLQFHGFEHLCCDLWVVGRCSVMRIEGEG